jgi:hypothetical protein
MKPPAAREPRSDAKAKSHFWKCFTIDLIGVALVTYAFGSRRSSRGFFWPCPWSCASE